MIKSGLLLTSTYCENIAWLVMHSSYTIKRSIESSQHMTDKYTVSYSTISYFLYSVSGHVFVLTTCSPCTVNVHPPTTFSEHLCSPFMPALLMLENSPQSENVTCCPHAASSCVKLHSKPTCRMTYNRYITYICYLMSDIQPYCLLNHQIIDIPLCSDFSSI